MKRIIFIAISLILLLGACSAGPLAAGVGARAVLKQQPIEPADDGFVSGVNSFGFKSASLLYDPGKNLALSPVSLEMALAMAGVGAEGVTSDEMKKALGLEGMAREDIISACRSLMWRCNTGGMEAANSVWLYKDYPFSEEYVKTCTQDFMADAFPLKIPGAMDDINAWANDKTHGKIDKIISQELDPATRIVLCNALYYLGDWEVPFENKDTYDSEFAASEGPAKVPFMHAERDAAYYKNDKLSMLSLPFKSAEGEGKYAMAFLLPAEGEGCEQLLASLDAGAFSEALSGLKEQQVRIALPKFEYTFFTSFKDALKSLGMNEAFETTADFSGMTGDDNDLYISEVLHKCYIRVDELGAEAAAVTVVEMCGAGAPAEDIAEFIADRPFLFCIYSQEDGAIAFMGAVNDPAKE